MPARASGSSGLPDHLITYLITTNYSSYMYHMYQVRPSRPGRRPAPLARARVTPRGVRPANAYPTFGSGAAGKPLAQGQAQIWSP